MKLPNLEFASVPREKVVKYLLNLEHEEGHSKAKFFLAHGFTAENWMELAAALRVHAQNHAVMTVEDSLFGMRYMIEGELAAPSGTAPYIRSVWFISTGESNPRLVTAYPVEPKHD